MLQDTIFPVTLLFGIESVVTVAHARTKGMKKKNHCSRGRIVEGSVEKFFFRSNKSSSSVVERLLRTPLT